MKTISPEEFVKIVMTSNSLEEISLKIGLVKNSIVSRIRRYVKKGVNLPVFKTNVIEKINVNRLNDLIDSILVHQTNFGGHGVPSTCARKYTK